MTWLGTNYLLFQECIMNKVFSLLCAIVLLATTSVCQASLLGVECQPDGDGAITMKESPQVPEGYTWEDNGLSQEGIPEYTFSIFGTHSVATGPSSIHPEDIGSHTAHMEGEFLPGQDGDPNVTFINSIDNDSGYTWVGYNVNLYMSVPFTILSASALNPLDWNPPAIVTPANWNGTYYVASVNYSAGTPIPNGGTFDFKYKINFNSPAPYNFIQEMTPIAVAVPEAGTLSLLSIMGAMVSGFALCRRK
jgi:hypothetical protein